MVIYFIANDVDLIDTNKLTVEPFFDLYFGELLNFKIHIFWYSGSLKKIRNAVWTFNICYPLVEMESN